MAFFLSFFVIRTIKFAKKENPYISMTTVALDNDESVDLGALDFIFAVEKLDPKVGRVTLTHTAWNLEGKFKTEIPLVDCNDFLDSS